MSHPTETTAETPDESGTVQQKEMMVHSHAAASATSNDDYDGNISDKKTTKQNQITRKSSQHETNVDVMKPETGSSRAEILEPDESSPSSGVVSPGPSSDTSNGSSHKSEENQPYKSQQSTPLYVDNASFVSQNGRMDDANRSKVGTDRNNSTPNSMVSSPSSKIHQENKDKAPLKPKPSSGVPSDPIHSYSAIRDSPASSDSTPKQGQNLRRGKWTIEEEAYVARVIQDFNNGFLDAPAGTTLRTFLSDKLSCDPMRITKKFTGDACIGKRVFHPAVRSPSNSALIDQAQTELKELERRWRVRLSMQRQESEKKHAVSAAAAAVASVAHSQDPSSTLSTSTTSNLSGNRVVVTRTASWLDRANAILSTRRSSTKEKRAKKETYGDEVKKQMKEVELLIQEGPTIQKSSGLLLQQGLHSTAESTVDPPSKRKVSDDQKITSLSGLPKTPEVLAKGRIPNEKEDKRMRKSLPLGNVKAEDMKSNFNLTSGEAEDAASFIGFISSVREEAAEAANSNKRND